MSHVIPVRCQHCGAGLQVDPRADSATCAYCGTTSLLRTRGAVVPGGAPVITVGPRGGRPWVLLAIMSFLIMAGVAMIMVRSESSAPPPAPEIRRAPAPVVDAGPGSAPAPAPADDEVPRLVVEHIADDRQPLLVDVDADTVVDVVALTRLQEGERSRTTFAAFSGATGALLWHVDAPEDAQTSVAAVVHGRLLVLTRTGQVIGHDLTGEQQWSTALGERGLRFCGATEPDSVLVPTADERVLLLDVKTGKQSPTRSPASCAPVPTDQALAQHDPRDRSDARAPIGVLGVRCGSVRVMGSESYTVPDACRARAKFDPDKLGGLVAHALWQTPGGWLVFGVRDPGTPTPLVGRVEGKTLAWKADVPQGNPLLASQGGPSPIAVVGDAIVAGYRLQAGSTQLLTAFARTDGQRLWHIEAPGGKATDRLAAANGQLLVYTDGSLFVLDGASGALLRTIGPATP